MALPTLPIELWLAIFRWATLSSWIPFAVYVPFQPTVSDPLSPDGHATAATRRAIVRVCKQWYIYAQEFLFEDVIVVRDGAALKRALSVGGASMEITQRRRIRRVSIPYSSCTPYTQRDCAAVAEFLQSCDRLEVLLRPSVMPLAGMDFEVPAPECPPLMSLKRLDWWHDNDAARSGGLNALPDVLRASPRLEYLSLGGDLSLSLMRHVPLELPALSILCLRRMNVLLMRQVSRWRMPCLSTLIVNAYNPPAVLEILAEVYSQSITTLEITMNPNVSNMYVVGHLLSCFPCVQKLGYHLEYTAAPYPPPTSHTSLHTLRLHVSSNDLLSCNSVKGSFWDHLLKHITTYPRDRFPELSRLELYGQWQHLASHPDFSRAVEHLHERRISIHFA